MRQRDSGSLRGESEAPYFPLWRKQLCVGSPEQTLSRLSSVTDIIFAILSRLMSRRGSATPLSSRHRRPPGGPPRQPVANGIGGADLVRQRGGLARASASRFAGGITRSRRPSRRLGALVVASNTAMHQ